MCSSDLANWGLGDRLLHLTAPNLRGDDVAELQEVLGRLGFDCGRVDGILGPRTSRALADFQANCGLVADGVCGPVTTQALLRVSSQTGDGPGVAAVRERERLVHDVQSLAMCRIVIGQFGGLSGLVRTLARLLRLHGAVVMPLDEPDAVPAPLVVAGRVTELLAVGPAVRAAVPELFAVAGSVPDDGESVPVEVSAA